MKKETGCTIHICDGCQNSYIQVKGEDLPSGYYVQVFEVHPGGAAAGDLYICSTRCLLKAFKRRSTVWSNSETDVTA